MKLITSLLVLLFICLGTAFAQESTSTYYCEADCGYAASRSCGGGFFKCPYYQGCGGVYAEGRTMGSAFDAMKEKCEVLKQCLLHNGFYENSSRAVRLNTNVKPSEVCRAE